MIIEFYTPDQQVNEWMITYVRDAILKLHSEHKEVARAEVSFRDAATPAPELKTCEISITIFGDSILVTGEGDSFDQAARKAVSELNTIIAVNFRPGGGPADEQVSTVQV